MTLSEPRRRLRRMTGRDPLERHRAATPLELLFDLTFVVAFSLAGDQVAHLLADGHVGAALAGFAFVMVAVCWAWINFTWFASAFDTDDWFFRVTTMVQMAGVLVLALGIAPVFHSIDEGRHLDNGVLVAGYVVMRVAMLAQWLRVAVQDPRHRRTALGYVVTIGVAQVGWIVVAVLDLPYSVLLSVLPVLYAIETGGPVIAERRTDGTPWHAHHIAERYGLLVIIALGEGVLGTIAAMSAVVERTGWSAEAVLVVAAGTALTFALWWVYFALPTGELLRARRRRSWAWGYGHIPLFAAIAAVGAGSTSRRRSSRARRRSASSARCSPSPSRCSHSPSSSTVSPSCSPGGSRGGARHCSWSRWRCSPPPWDSRRRERRSAGASSWSCSHRR